MSPLALPSSTVTTTSPDRRQTPRDPERTSRPDRKATARLLSAKGLSTREIAKVTGWHQTTIARDLSDAKASKSDANASPARPSLTGSAETVQHRKRSPRRLRRKASRKRQRPPPDRARI